MFSKVSPPDDPATLFLESFSDHLQVLPPDPGGRSGITILSPMTSACYDCDPASWRYELKSNRVVLGVIDNLTPPPPTSNQFNSLFHLSRQISRKFTKVPENSRRIPRIIHQIDFSPSTTNAKPPMYDIMKSWKVMNPGYEYILWNDSMIKDYVSKNTDSEIQEVFKELDFVQKSDLFRYIILFKIGGVYADHDAECIKPIDHWDITTNTEVVVGIEGVGTTLQKEGLLWARNPQFCQWTLAATPGHPILWSAVSRIKESVKMRILDRAESSRPVTDYKDKEREGGCEELGHISCIETIELTGPGLFSDGVMRYLSTFGLSPNEAIGGIQVGSLTVVPVDAFACGQMHSGADLRCMSPLVVVKHHFAGNWKTAADNKNKNSVGVHSSPPVSVVWDDREDTRSSKFSTGRLFSGEGFMGAASALDEIRSWLGQ
ncbi:hypothetical protein AAMO2058_000304800 [Amorphochlora amoebiformis]